MSCITVFISQVNYHLLDSFDRTTRLKHIWGTVNTGRILYIEIIRIIFSRISTWNGVSTDWQIAKCILLLFGGRRRHNCRPRSWLHVIEHGGHLHCESNGDHDVTIWEMSLNVLSHCSFVEKCCVHLDKLRFHLRVWSLNAIVIGGLWSRWMSSINRTEGSEGSSIDKRTKLTPLDGGSSRNVLKRRLLFSVFMFVSGGDLASFV